MSDALLWPSICIATRAGNAVGAEASPRCAERHATGHHARRSSQHGLPLSPVCPRVDRPPVRLREHQVVILPVCASASPLLALAHPMRPQRVDKLQRQGECCAARLSCDGIVRGPDLPGDVEWHQMTRAWWDARRRSPHAQTFIELEWMFLLETAMLHSLLWSGRTDLAAEIRIRSGNVRSDCRRSASSAHADRGARVRVDG